MTKNLQLLLLFVTSLAFGQSFTGLKQDNYAGIHGVIANPANVYNTPYKVDINLFSTSVLAGTNAFNFDIDKLDQDGYDLLDDEESKRFSNTNFLNVNLDILGPSFLININEKSSAALTIRGRAVGNANNINGNLIDEFETIEDGLNGIIDLRQGKSNNTANVWTEIAATYGLELIKNEDFLISAGVTAKYLIGNGALTADLDDVLVQFDEDAEQGQVNGSLSYVYTESFDPNEDFTYQNDGRGFGLDLGAVFELKKANSKKDDSFTSNRPNYLFKVGVSVTDLGKINYDNVTRETYTFNENLDRDAIIDKGIEALVDDIVDPTITKEELEIKLPTTLRLNIDWNAYKKFYINTGYNQSLNAKNRRNANRILREYFIAPRLETKFLTIGTSFLAREDLNMLGEET